MLRLKTEDWCLSSKKIRQEENISYLIKSFIKLDNAHILQEDNLHFSIYRFNYYSCAQVPSQTYQTEVLSSVWVPCDPVNFTYYLPHMPMEMLDAWKKI